VGALLRELVKPTTTTAQRLETSKGKVGRSQERKERCMRLEEGTVLYLFLI
jgi:hypothetical protein